MAWSTVSFELLATADRDFRSPSLPGCISCAVAVRFSFYSREVRSPF